MTAKRMCAERSGGKERGTRAEREVWNDSIQRMDGGRGEGRGL